MGFLDGDFFDLNDDGEIDDMERAVEINEIFDDEDSSDDEDDFDDDNLDDESSSDDKNDFDHTGVTKTGRDAFAGTQSLKNQNEKITTANIKDGTVKIIYGAFHGCSSLKEITIPNSVTEIELGTFSDCSNLEKITIPDSVTEIRERAFNGCSENLIIYTPQGSYAEKYAKEHGIKVKNFPYTFDVIERDNNRLNAQCAELVRIKDEYITKLTSMLKELNELTFSVTKEFKSEKLNCFGVSFPVPNNVFYLHEQTDNSMTFHTLQQRFPEYGYCIVVDNDPTNALISTMIFDKVPEEENITEEFVQLFVDLANSEINGNPALVVLSEMKLVATDDNFAIVSMLKEKIVTAEIISKTKRKSIKISVGKTSDEISSEKLIDFADTVIKNVTFD